jgi:LPS sulfotransferase NodH
MNQEHITIVSGLPRSGTSLMMQMLEAGGMTILSDYQRAADVDNPGGYYEYEPVKQLKKDPTSIEAARGKVVKIISELLTAVPPHYRYTVIFMRRSMAEILASQRQMLIRRGKQADGVDEAALGAMFEKHLRRVESWLAQQPHIQTCFISYNELVADPTPHIQAINRCLGGQLDEQRMARMIDQKLYRQRSS